MTRAEALRAIVTRPREVPDDGRIGKRVIHAEPDHQKLRTIYVFRMLKSALRRVS